MKITRWVLLEEIVGAAFVGSMFLLGAPFFTVWGGGLGVLLFGASVHFVATKSSKAAREILERLGFYGYTILALNVLIGLKKAFPVQSLFWSICAGVALILATLACLSLVNLFLPPHRTTAELPPWGARLWRKLMIPLVVSLFLPAILQLVGSLFGLHGDKMASERNTLIVLLISCILIGTYSIRGVVGGLSDHRVVSALRRLLILSPAWIIVGTVAEVLRGEWLAWSLSALTILIVLTWTIELSRRSTVLAVTRDA